MRNGQPLHSTFADVAAIAAILAGACGIAAWWLGVPAMAGALGPMPPMRVSAAVCLLLGGVSLLARREPLASGAAAAMFAVATGTLAEYAAHRSFGFDTLLVFAQGPAFAGVPMRMPFNAAVSMMALGFGLSAMRCPRRGVRIAAEVLAVAALLIVVFAAVTLIVDEHTHVSRYISMVPATSAIVVLLAAGILARVPDGWCRARITSRNADGVMLRRMPVILLIPVGVAWLRIRGQELGLFNTPFGISVQILATVTLLCAAIFWGVSAVERELRIRFAAVAALEESEERQRLAVEGSRIGMWFWNLTTGTLVWTPRCREIFGLSPSDPVDFSIFESRLHPDDRPKMNAAVEASWRDRTDFNTSYRALMPDGTSRWIGALGRTWYDASGVPQRMMGVVQDIDEQQRTVDALARSNADLERFAYIVSHDLQEPLRMVASYVELLRRRYAGQLDADADDFIGFASEGAQRMKRMLDDLLAYSRVSRDSSIAVPVDVNDAVNDCVANLRLAIDESRAIIRRGDLPPVIANAAQLGHVLTNLVGNALKFRNGHDPLIRIAGERDGAWCHYTVADNGIGIEPRHFERIFLMFQRLHLRGEYPGTGMGLAIAKRVVEQHGGQMWVTSTPGVGSTFHFTLRAAEAT